MRALTPADAASPQARSAHFITLHRREPDLSHPRFALTDGFVVTLARRPGRGLETVTAGAMAEATAEVAGEVTAEVAAQVRVLQAVRGECVL